MSLKAVCATSHGIAFEQKIMVLELVIYRVDSVSCSAIILGSGSDVVGADSSAKRS
jgi:hypothetical protein